MKKYQVVELDIENKHAGSKAVNDVEIIADSMGYNVKLYIQNYKFKKKWYNSILNQFSRMKSWFSLYRSIEPSSILLLQHPYRRIQFFRDFIIERLKKRKNVKIISIIHDIDELRDEVLNLHHKKERAASFKDSSILVVHNQSMKQFVMSKGVPESKIVVLGVFDYLYNGDYNPPKFTRKINIAGNFEKWKSGYVYELSRIGSVGFNLFGPNYKKKEKQQNVDYKGSFSPDELVSKLNEGFGLVWDGPELNTCTGGTGIYLKYNNPHKLSLYLASGIPVIIWKEAALAPFIQENGLGFAIDSLYDLPGLLNSISREKYDEMVKKMEKESYLIRKGEYMRNAFISAENKLANP